MATEADGPPRMTIREIADLAGVSIATVSRVLNGRDDVVGRDARARHAGSSASTATRPTAAPAASRPAAPGWSASSCRSSTRRTSRRSSRGAAEALYEQRHADRPLAHRPRARPRGLAARPAVHGLTDGALIILPEESSDELERLLDDGYRFVVVDPLMPLDERIPSVSAAHTSGADQAMRHLLGARAPADRRRSPARAAGSRREDRRRGYHAALAAAGILPDPALEVEVRLRDRPAA